MLSFLSKKVILYSTLGVIVIVSVFCYIKFKPETPPNVIIFLVDDMGWQDTSVPFWTEKTPLNNSYHTPNMEKMASLGMKFTQAYATPICSPSRVSLITGTNSARHRVTNWTLLKDTPTDIEDEELILPQWNVNGISPIHSEQAFYSTPLPQILSDNGYYTINVGKAHFGALGTVAADPLNIGFQVNIAGHAGGGLQSYYGKDNFGNLPFKAGYQATPGLQEFYGQDIFITEALTQKAIKELDKRPKDKPFFLYLAHYAVHIPIMPDPRFIQKYLDKGMDPNQAAYASLVEGVDKSLGDILEYLDKNKLTDNTIVIFMSDNGGLDLEHRGRSGKTNTHNAPLSSGKGSLYEGGIREPMIVMWKGKIMQGSVTDEKIIIEDFFPTILDVAQVNNYSTAIHQVIDGKSFLPLLKGEDFSNEDRPLFWHVPNRWTTICDYGIGPESSVRLGDYKLIYSYKTQKKELFNIKNDISEKVNLVDSLPEKAQELSVILTQYLKRVNAQIPSDKATHKNIPYPDGTLQ